MMEELNYCRACLITDVQMYNMKILSKHESFSEIYSQLLAITIKNYHNDHCLCYECAKLLQKFTKFKSKCLRANEILSKIESNGNVVTKQDIQNIDRKQNKLVSDLNVCPIFVTWLVPNDTTPKDFETIEVPMKEEQNEFYVYNDQDRTGDEKSLEEKPIIIPTVNCNDMTSKTCTQNSKIYSHSVKSKHKDDTSIYKTKLVKHMKNIKLSNAKKKNNKTKHHKSNIKAIINQKSLNTNVKTTSVIKSNLPETCNEKVPISNVNDTIELVENSQVHPIDNIVITSNIVKKDFELSTNTTESTVSQIHNENLEDFFNLSDDEPLTSLAKLNTSETELNNDRSERSKTSKDYSVVWLTLEDAQNEVQVRKETNNYKLSPYKCDLCFKGFLTLKTFENHMKRHNVESGEFECPACYIRYPSKYKLREHKLFCHERRFVCSWCPAITNNTTQANAHATSHKEKFPCKVCGKLYRMSHSLISHMKTQHPEHVDETVCEFCGNVFFSPRGLRMHHLRSHAQEKNEKQGPECDTCGVHFCSDAAWKLHLVMSSKHKAGYGCKTCGETFASPEELRAHNKIHPHQPKCRKSCRLCGIQFDQRREYCAHVRAQHPDKAEALLKQKTTPFMCDLCGKIYKNSTLLAYHFRKHTGERPFSCGQCGKKFATKCTLLAHGAVHQTIRYECDDCGQLVTNKGNLIRHKKAAHLNSRPHKCTLCDKRFVNRCDMKIHIKYSHNKVPWPKKKKRSEVEKVPPTE